MAKNIMKLLKPSPNLGRNAFDLSHRNVFTANFGELLPCCCIETVPSHDYIEIKPANLLRAMPLVTSPFLRAKQHIDFWFVPYQALWSRFNEFISDKDEPNSSAFKNRAFLPYIDLPGLWPYVSPDGLNRATKDIHGRSYSAGACKLLNLLGYGINDVFTAGDGPGNYKVNPFRLAAYNFIWYKEYRQQYFDDGTYLTGTHNPSLLFNFDSMECSTVSNADIVHDYDQSDLSAMCQLRYRCWKKDLFTGLMPSQQFGDVSVINGTLDSDLGLLTLEPNDAGVYPDSLEPGSPSSVRHYSIEGFDSGNQSSAGMLVRNSGISVLDLRKAEAIQKWRENALRAGNQIEDNFEAHYGAKPHSHLISHPTYIGSYDSPLNIGDVVSTAQTGDGANQALGDIAGKGLSSINGDTIRFKTTDFGVIMGIFSLLPEAEYNALGIDRMNQLLEREDFFIPEYENLGLEPVDSSVFYSQFVQGDNFEPVIGFAPRYWGYKQKFDQCFGQLMNSGNPNDPAGMFAHWCSPKSDVIYAINQNHGFLPLSCLYVNPKIFDINFNVSVDDCDQFLVDEYNEVTAIRGMSISGLPSY